MCKAGRTFCGMHDICCSSGAPQKPIMKQNADLFHKLVIISEIAFFYYLQIGMV